MQTLVQLLPHTECGFCFAMFRARLSQLLAVAAAKVAENKTPDYVRSQLKQRRQALVAEINDYRVALSNFISPN